MSYSGLHETSNIRPGTVKAGARRPQGGAALQGNLRDAPIPDTAGQRPRPLAAQDRREPRVRLPDGAQRHPRLQREGHGRPHPRLLPSEACPRRLRRGGRRSLEGAFAPLPEGVRIPDEPVDAREMAAEVAFEEGLSGGRVSGETIRATLSRLLGIRWQRAKRWITSPDPLYERKKGGATD